MVVFLLQSSRVVLCIVAFRSSLAGPFWSLPSIGHGNGGILHSTTTALTRIQQLCLALFALSFGLLEFDFAGGKVFGLAGPKLQEIGFDFGFVKVVAQVVSPLTFPFNQDQHVMEQQIPNLVRQGDLR